MAKKDKNASVEVNEGGLPLVPPNEVYTRKVEVEFSDDELISKGLELVETLIAIDTLEDEMKASNDNFKSEIEVQEEKTMILRKELKDKRGEISVECEVYFNVPNTGRKQIVRKDTEEVLEELDMSQQEIFERNQGKLDM